MKILTCLRLCLALYYDNGFPVKGMPDKCYCADKVDKKTEVPLPITLSFPKPKEKPRVEEDTRETRVYE